MHYCPDSEARFILCVSRGRAEAEALDASQDVVRSRGPAESFRVCIGSLEVGIDRVFEIGDGAEHALPEGTFSQ